MKCINPEIAWHNREPVFSVDIQKGPISINDNETVYRLASGGGDYHVVVWHIKVKSDGLPTFEIAADLNRHQKAVNVVRFSPSGEYLASGDDEGVILVWRQKEGGVATAEHLFEQVSGSENWVVAKILRGHLGDVYDMCWSPDSKYLISGSIDNKAILWNAVDGKYEHIFQDHKGFVQGVAWDPKNKLFATLASDRFCRFFRTADNKVVARAVKTGDNSKPEENDKCYLFHDDTFKSFFRRLTFTPDGNLVLAPSGVIDERQEEEPAPPVEEDEDVQCETPKPKAKRKPKFAGALHIFSRFSLKKPCLSVPLGYDKYCVAVRCCPVMFEHEPLLNEETSSIPEDKQPPMVTMPHRVVFAVATQDAVLLFDTKQQLPIGKVTAIHYTGITDLAWSCDGRALIISSTDGYCSIITFKPGELGVPLQATPPVIAAPETTSCVAVCPVVEALQAMPTAVAKETTNCVVDEETEDIKLVLEDTVDNVQQLKENISKDTVEDMDIDDKPSIDKKIESPKMKSDVGSPLRGTGRRVQLITLSSPKKKKA